MRNTIIIIVILVIVVLGVYYIYSYNNSYQTPTTSQPSTVVPTPTSTEVTPAPTTPATANALVSIKNFAFSPSTLNIKTGTEVTWTNNDTVAHTVTADSGTLINSSTLSPGQSYSVTFTNAGTMSYHCSIHPNMHGKVVVTN